MAVVNNPKKYMTERDITLPKIKKALFDPSQIERSTRMRWRIGADAQPVSPLSSDLKDEIMAALSPSSQKVERASQFASFPEVVIGGFCSIFTGDLTNRNVNAAVSQVRMDQIVESVGSVRGKPVFTIIEDSFFERLTGLSRVDIQKQAENAKTRIIRWLELSTGQSPNLFTASTSEPAIEQGLTGAVAYLANDVLKNSDFQKIQAAPILLMYTSLWSELLSSLGVIPSSNVVCVEPTIHFIDDRSIPDQRLSRAYLEFLEWLRDNPYGADSSRNQSFAIAGFLESYSGDQTKKRTRLLTGSEVPTTANYRQWSDQLSTDANRFPFPLRGSPLFAEAVNWGFWDPETLECIGSLINLEEEYYSTKKSFMKGEGNPAVNQEWAQWMRRGFGEQTKPLTSKLARKIENILTTVLGD